MQTVNLSSRVVRHPEIIFAEAGDDVLMMSIEKGEYYGLSSVGSFLWELMAVPVSVESLCQRTLQEYKVDEATCQSDVLEFVTKLVDNGTVQLAT